MDNYKKLVDVLKQAIGGNNNIPLINAEVKEITGESCTVLFGVDNMELTEVRLKSTINESGNYLLLVPKIGTMVTCGSFTGDFKDLCVLSVDEVETVKYVQDGLELEINSTDGKVSVKNGEIGLLDLFNSLVTILKSLKVFTPVGPSGTILPDILIQVDQFETDFKKLLK